jgi:hypothetical protein
MVWQNSNSFGLSICIWVEAWIIIYFQTAGVCWENLTAPVLLEGLLILYNEHVFQTGNTRVHGMLPGHLLSVLWRFLDFLGREVQITLDSPLLALFCIPQLSKYRFLFLLRLWKYLGWACFLFKYYISTKFTYNPPTLSTAAMAS